MDTEELVRRDFATGWGQIGQAWGVAPSTAAVQGYLLMSSGSLTEAELRNALGLSHRAAFTALAQCEGWGLIEQVGSRRAGARGPASRAWVAVADHWEWFRRVAGARKARETDPILPLLDGCLRRAEALGASDLAARVQALLLFTHQFDGALSAVVRSESAALAHLFGALGQLEGPALERLLAVLTKVPEAELAKAVRTLATMRPTMVRGLVRLAGTPGISRILATV